jgi:hypothetical protein
MKNTLALATAFVLGCTVAAVVPSLLRSAHADTPAPRQQWEQLCVPAEDGANNNAKNVKNTVFAWLNTPTGWNKLLTSYGAQGWELVGVIGDQVSIGAVCFKRPR